MLDVAVVAEPDMSEAAAVTGAQIAAHPVVVELVEVGTVAEGHTARPGWRGREQLVADRGVLRDRVVVDVDVHVEAVLQLRTGRQAVCGLAGIRIRIEPANRVGTRELALTDVDATRERPGVVRDAVVGDLEVMPPAVHEDAATALRAVGNGQPVDAGRIAVEVARKRIRARIVAAAAALAAGAVGQQDRASGESRRRRRAPSERIGVGREQHTLRQHSDPGALESAHQGRLLQQLGHVAVLRGVPAQDRFQWQAVDLRIGVRIRDVGREVHQRGRRA